MRCRAAVVAVALAGTALAVTACGSGTAQVVGNAPGTHAAAAPLTTLEVAPTSTTAPAPTAPTGTPPTTTPTTAPVTSPVGPAAVNRLNAALGALGQSLDQADSDLAQAQGDQ